MSSSHIAVVGSVNVDMVVRCATLPRPGETVSGLGLQVHTGGKGANQAVAAARLGAAVSFVGCVGDDAFGQQAMKALRDEGIDTRHLTRVPGSTGAAMIMVEASAQNCIVVEPGANALLSPQAVEAAADAISSASMLVCQLETPLSGVQRALEIARRAGVPVLLNPAPAMPLPTELLRLVDFLIPNETEAAIVAALPGERDAQRCARNLREQGVQTVIVTLGARGACVVRQSGAQLLEPYAVQAVDTTGAGDAFVGAFAVACCEGADVIEAADFAQRAASISVTRSGAMAAMPRRSEMVEKGLWPPVGGMRNGIGGR